MDTASGDANHTTSADRDRIARRAEYPLPEERAAGSGDRWAQAAEILADSDRRTAGQATPDAALERRTSEQTVTPPEPPD